MDKKNELRITHKNLKHPIKFFENFSANNLLLAENWQEIYSCFAEILPMNNASFTSIDGISFGHINIENLCIFRIRFKDELSNKMRIKFRDKYFEIKKINNIYEVNKVLQIIALEIA